MRLLRPVSFFVCIGCLAVQAKEPEQKVDISWISRPTIHEVVRDFSPTGNFIGVERAFYTKVVQLERTHPAFAGSDVAPLTTDHPNDIISYRRSKVVVLVNTRPSSVAAMVNGTALGCLRSNLRCRPNRQHHQSRFLQLRGVGNEVTVATVFGPRTLLNFFSPDVVTR